MTNGPQHWQQLRIGLPVGRIIFHGDVNLVRILDLVINLGNYTIPGSLDTITEVKVTNSYGQFLGTFKLSNAVYFTDPY